jgi:hypothetical protein
VANHYAFSITSGTNGTGTFPGEFGDEITVSSSNITCIALGAYLDAGAGAWTSDKIVNVWDSSTQTVVASVTLHPTDIGSGSVTQVGQYVFKSISPVTLAAGKTYVVAANGYGTDKYYGQVGSGNISEDGGGGAITFPSPTGFLNSTAGVYPNSSGGALYGSGSLQYSSGVSAGALTVSSLDSTGITLSVGSVSGGTTPYSYQWYSSNNPSGGFAAIPGATSSSCKAASTGAPLYAYCVVTDALSSTATSWGYENSVGSLGNLPFCVVPEPNMLNVVLVGDSRWTTGQNYDQTTLTNRLSQLLAPQSASVNNQAISGTSSQTWLLSSPSGHLSAMISALSAGVYTFCIKLGTNDAKASGNISGESTHLSATQYAANLASICSTLLGTAKFAGSTCVLFGPNIVVSGAGGGEWDDTSVSLLYQYTQQIAGVCNGRTIRKGFADAEFRRFAENMTLFSDGVHETVAGGTTMAESDARAIVAVLAPSDTMGGACTPVGCDFIKGL